MTGTVTDPALMSAEALLALYARGQLSPVEVLQAVIERVARHNPAVNAFAVMNPGALQAAGDSAQRWRAGRPLGPLDGVPCTVKDLVDLAGFPTRRGSRTTSPDLVPDDAPAVLGLKAAGAVIVGKTTTTEFGWKTPGDCPLHGITRNPFDLSRTPGGSSSGAAAAAAAGFGPLHLGTDAGGSIRIPAAWCGMVGLKPTFGRVPQWPIGAFGAVAVAGPITRTVRDAALMLSALARFDARDPYSLPDDPRDWRNGIEGGVAGLRISVLRRPGFEAPVDAEGIAAVEQAAAVLVDAGAAIEDEDPGLPDAAAAFGRVWGVALAALVEALPPGKRGLLDAGMEEVGGASGATRRGDAANRGAAGGGGAPDGAVPPPVRPGSVPHGAGSTHAGRRAHGGAVAGADAGLGAVDCAVQPDPAAGDHRAARAGRRRAAAQRAGGGAAVSGRPGAACRPGAGAGRAFPNGPSGLTRLDARSSGEVCGAHRLQQRQRQHGREQVGADGHAEHRGPTAGGVVQQRRHRAAEDRADALGDV